MPSEAFVYDAVRTPRGRGRDTGALHGVKPISLVVGLIDALRERNPGLDLGRLEDLLLGIVTPVGEQGGDLARAAALLAGLPDQVGGVQLNRFCASGLEAVNPPPRGSAPAGSTCCSPAASSRCPGCRWAPTAAPGPSTRRPPWPPAFVPQGISADLIATLEGFTRDDVDGYALRVAGAGRQGAGRRLLRPLGGAGPRPQRPGHPRPSTSTRARRPPVEALARLNPSFADDRRGGAASTRSRCRSTTGWSASSTCTTPATRPASWTARRWC